VPTLRNAKTVFVEKYVFFIKEDLSTFFLAADVMLFSLLFFSATKMIRKCQRFKPILSPSGEENATPRLLKNERA
jgi:hypothetical protein